MPLEEQVTSSEFDLTSACWETATQEERINELEKTTGQVHVTCAKDYLPTKVRELLENYNKTHKDSCLNVTDLVILDIASSPLYFIFYPKNHNTF